MILDFYEYFNCLPLKMNTKKDINMTNLTTLSCNTKTKNCCTCTYFGNTVEQFFNTTLGLTFTNINSFY